MLLLVSKVRRQPGRAVGELDLKSEGPEIKSRPDRSLDSVSVAPSKKSGAMLLKEPTGSPPMTSCDSYPYHAPFKLVVSLSLKTEMIIEYLLLLLLLLLLLTSKSTTLPLETD